MNKKLNLKLIIFAIIVHLIIFYSIIDIYFKSPLAKGMKPIDYDDVVSSFNNKFKINKQARRLVLFVGDGLRADTLDRLVFTNEAKFLKSKIELGSSGLSYTRVPTESRPGHVAIIAGFYEDISAVTKGWKENPIEFDSVFNRSTYCFSWGSPDILNMFTKYSNNIYAESYEQNDENFASNNASLLDIWVLDKFTSFLENSKMNSTLTELLKKDGIVFFFHFLGIDTNGHSKKPYSIEYIENVLIVDKIIEKINKLLDDYYSNDNLTSYIFTADHGMTDWGSHGSGDDTERLTPFIVWGAGIQNSNNISIDQADIAPLMSYLIGVPIPLNSIGKIPLSVLNANDRTKSLVYKLNALQIFEQLKIKHNEIKHSSLFFKEFSSLHMSEIYAKFELIDKNIINGKYSETIIQLNSLIDKILEALDYYNKYYKFYLGFCISSAYIGWIFYLISFNWASDDDKATKSTIKLINNLFIMSNLIIIYLSYIQSFPISFYIYAILPLILWQQIILKYKFWKNMFQLFNKQLVINILKFILLFIGIELLLLSFFYRQILTVMLILYSFILIYLLKSNQSYMKWIIITSPMVLSIFPSLKPISGEMIINLVYCSIIVMNISYLILIKKENKFQNLKWNSSLFLFILNIITFINIYYVRKNIENKINVSIISQLISYSNIIFCTIVPILSTTKNIKNRLIKILYCFLNLYFHLSISYESVFILCLCLQMLTWLLLECFFYSNSFSIYKALTVKGTKNILTYQNDDKQHLFTWTDLLRVYLLFFHILIAFFGTGNIASINSFDVVSVYCFTTIFSPFLMGFLLVIKIIIPFLIVISIFYFIYEINNLSIRNSFILLMIISDIMALQFLFLIRTEGSWLDIGMSISHFVISMSSVIAIVLLFFIVEFLFTGELARVIRLFKKID